MEDIKVHVVKRNGRKYLALRYICPTTGKKIERSAGTARRREAERTAAVWEDDLRNGRYQSPSKILWSDFRERYETHLEATVSDSTAGTFCNVFSVFERIVNPERLAAVKKAQIQKFVQTLRDEDKATATIRSYLGHLKAALRWAHAEGLVTEVPPLKAPTLKQNGKVIKQQESGGRALVAEEYERMLLVVPAVLYPKRKDSRSVTVDDTVVESWKHLVSGLFWSGLRISEAHVLTWDDTKLPSVDFTGEHPMLWIPGQFQKNGKDTRCPMAPEFAEFLLQTPEADRRGFVFNPIIPRIAGRPALATFKRKIADFGRKANVKVKDMESGQVKHASSHDLRRSFGFRWALRVMPAILKELMRHSDIQTTMRFYVSQNAQETAKAVWKALPSNAGAATKSGSEVTLQVTPTDFGDLADAAAIAETP